MIQLKSKIATFKELKGIDQSAYEMYKYIVSNQELEILDKDVIYYGFGVLLTDKGVYILVSEKNDDYLTLKPLALFEIIDYSIPDYWITTEGKSFNSTSLKVFNLITFKEWSDDDFFYEKLIQGDSGIEKLFENYKKIIINNKK